MWIDLWAASPSSLSGQRKLDWELVGLGGILLVLIALGGWMVSRFRNWREEEKSENLPREQQAEQYRRMLEEGLLEPEEFERLHRRLLGPWTHPEALRSPPDAPPPEHQEGNRPERES